MGPMTELLKGKGKGKKPARVERSDEELLALMDELFGAGEGEEPEGEDMDKGAGYSYGSKTRKGSDPRAELLRRAEMMGEEEEEPEDEDMGKGMGMGMGGEEPEDEDMEKAKKERRAMMDRAYSLIDNLSEAQLKAFLAEHEISKALAMMVIGSMEASDLRELVSFEDANGSPATPEPNPHGV
jgi:hypothetical protein